MTHPRRQPTRPARASVALIALVLGTAAVGCSHVAPYEREYLARPGMDVGDRERQQERFHAHVYDAREAATGTTDSAGGGCGCN